MNRGLGRRLGRLGTSLITTNCRTPLVFRDLLVHPEQGLTGVLVLDGDKPMRVDETPEESETVRADLERRRAARLLWKGGSH